MLGRGLAHGVAALVLLTALGACVGTTGGQLITFTAAAAGPRGAAGTVEFVSGRGWHVVLTKGILHVGAVYLDQSLPVSGSQGTNCVLTPTTYVAQVTAGRDVDLLSGVLQPFPMAGQGTTSLPARVGQVWLTGGDVNTTVDPTPILTIAGTADLAGSTISFQGTITISSNRQATGGVAAGGDPICKERIVSVPASVNPQTTGGLVLRIDPSLLFTNVDFSQLTAGADGTYRFSDDPTSTDYTSASRNLYQNLHAAGALYTFSWSSAP